MKSGKRFNTITTRIMMTGLFILSGCLLACVIHLITVGEIFMDNAEDELLGHMQVAVEVINGEVAQQREVTEVCGELVRYCKDITGITPLLVECEHKYDGYSFYYVTAEGKTYYSNGNILHNGDFEKLSNVRRYEYKNNFICITYERFNIKGESLSYWVGIYPVRDEDGAVQGYFLSSRNNQDMFENACFDYISDLGIACLIDTDGNVIVKDENYVTSFGREDNYYAALEEFSNQSAVSNEKIASLGNSIQREEQGNTQIVSAAGKKVFVAFQQIQATRNKYLVVTFHEDILQNMIQPVLLRSFVLWVIILVIMIVTILVVWNSGRTARKTVEKLAYDDVITGGRNLNYFRKFAPEIMNQHREFPFMIYRFDILNFRYINEAYGHEKADTVLRACIEEFARIYSENELCVRINSDHFLALVINNTECTQNYQNYTRAIGECARENGVRYPIRLRVGIYKVRKEDKNIDIMIDHANAARKSLTGNEKVLESFYSELIVSNMKKVDAIESQMQSAITNDEFKIYLQPKWDIVHNRLSGAEALVRWIKDDGSMVYPSDFIPLFETNGFIEKLDFHMLEKLCEKLQILETEGKYNLVPISINQSRILINNPDYVRNVERVISRYNTNVNILEIEITETVFFDEKGKMIEVVKQLKELGLKLAMDDFGTGYSSLNILRDIPFDILKIDREFVSESVASSSAVVIMQKIIEMAQGLNIDVVCEGVESADQIETLRKLGCTSVQGYYYDKPIPIDEFMEKYCKKDEAASS